VRHCDDRPHYGCGVRIADGFLHEALIDLQTVNLVLQQIGEAAEPGAEVIDRNPHPKLAHLLELVQRVG
jgi:hypothetical protein